MQEVSESKTEFGNTRAIIEHTVVVTNLAFYRSQSPKQNTNIIRYSQFNPTLFTVILLHYLIKRSFISKSLEPQEKSELTPKLAFFQALSLEPSSLSLELGVSPTCWFQNTIGMLTNSTAITSLLMPPPSSCWPSDGLLPLGKL